MIWFTCKCGKTHGRPETAIGATIFCECGAGVVVPWESTAAEPPAQAVPEIAPALKLEPINLEPLPAQSSPPRPGPSPPARGRRRARQVRRDPNYCFNHERLAKQGACDDCGESFCASCLVTFDEAALCAPCKNYRVKNLQRPVPASNLSWASVLVALFTAALILSLLPAGRLGVPWWSIVALATQMLAATLAVLALRQKGKDAEIAGTPLALTGLLGAVVTTVLIILRTVYTPHPWA
jgi:hypothetical protein